MPANVQAIFLLTIDRKVDLRFLGPNLIFFLKNIHSGKNVAVVVFVVIVVVVVVVIVVVIVVVVHQTAKQRWTLLAFTFSKLGLTNFDKNAISWSFP